MKYISDPASLSIVLAFPILRVLSLVSKPMGEHPVHKELADEGIITLLFGLFDYWFQQVCSRVNQYLLYKPDFPSTSEDKMALREALHVLFGVTVDMGTLARGELMSYEK